MPDPTFEPGGYEFSPAELQEIEQLRLDEEWAAAYQKILEFISILDPVSGEPIEPKSAVDPSAWLWIRGAILVNTDSGFICGYRRHLLVTAC